MVLLAFGLQIAVLWGAFNSQVGFYQDEAFVLECSSRMLRGELPWRDYMTRFMPGTNWILNGFFLALGENVVAMRLYFLMMAGLLAASVQWFSQKLLPRGWSEIPTLLFLTVGIQTWPMVSFHWDATIFTLLALGILAPARTTKRLLAAGVLCGVTVLFLQTKGLATCLGAGIMLLLEPLPFKERGRNLGLLIAGAAIPGAAFVLWLLVNGLAGWFYSRAVGFNTSRYLLLHRSPLDFSPLVQEVQVLAQGLQHPTVPGWFSWLWRAASFTAVDFIKFGGYYPVLLGGAALAVLQARRPWTPATAAFVSLVAVLLFASLFDFGRPNRYRLHFQAPLWNAVLVYLLYCLSCEHKKIARVLTALVMVAYLGHGLDNWSSWAGFKYAVDFPRGRLYFNDARLAAHLHQIQGLVSPLTPPGTPVFGFPQQNLLLWLLDTPNPTTYPECIPVLYPREAFLQVRKELDERRVPWVLFTPLDPNLSGDYPNVPPEEVIKEQGWAIELLSEGYEKALETPDVLLYRRK